MIRVTPKRVILAISLLTVLFALLALGGCFLAPNGQMTYSGTGAGGTWDSAIWDKSTWGS